MSDEASHDARTDADRWLRVLWLGLGLWLPSAALVLAYAGADALVDVLVQTAAYALPGALTAFGRGRVRTAGVWLAMLLAVSFALGNLPILIEDLGHPDSPLPFLATAFAAAGAALVLVAGATRLWPVARPRTAVAAAAVFLGLTLVAAAVGALSVSSDERLLGDIDLVADKDCFEPAFRPRRTADDVTVRAQRNQALYLDNRNRYPHTFTVEALGIDVELPAGAGRRLVLDVERGRYRFTCTMNGHGDDMSGTLIVF